MSDIKVYMTPVEPPVLSFDTAGTSTDSEDSEDTSTITIKMVPENQSSVVLSVPILHQDDNYIFALWNPGPSYLSWERSYIETQEANEEYGIERKVSPKAGIDITYKNPAGDIPVIPYWSNSVVSAINPDKFSPHSPFIFKVEISPGIELGLIPESGDKEDYWNKGLSETGIFHETTPIVRPGENIELCWTCWVNGKKFTSPKMLLGYETPLFTGGWIRSKDGEGVEVTYSVEVFQNLISNIMPTDFYNYEVGDWVYLMKTDASLELDPNTDNKQMYGDSGVSSSSPSGSGIILENTNRQRVLNDRVPFTVNSKLEESAQKHAEDMASGKFVSHTGSNGSTITERIKSSGFMDGIDTSTDYWDVGENVGAYCSTSEVVGYWMDSPGHKANLLKEQYKEIGIGRAQDDDGYWYFVQNFGFRTDAVANSNKDYRVVPFDFKGPMSIEAGISGLDAIEIDSATDFETAFDMIKYEGVISDINTSNDTATFTYKDEDDIDVEKTGIPIFYYCEGEPVIEGGSSAFTEDDDVIVEVPEGTSWDDAKIIGFPGELKPCSRKNIALISLHFGDGMYKYIFINLETKQIFPFRDEEGNIIPQPMENTYHYPLHKKNGLAHRGERYFIRTTSFKNDIVEGETTYYDRPVSFEEQELCNYASCVNDDDEIIIHHKCGSWSLETEESENFLSRSSTPTLYNFTPATARSEGFIGKGTTFDNYFIDANVTNTRSEISTGWGGCETSIDFPVCPYQSEESFDLTYTSEDRITIQHSFRDSHPSKNIRNYSAYNIERVHHDTLADEHSSYEREVLTNTVVLEGIDGDKKRTIVLDYLEKVGSDRFFATPNYESDSEGYCNDTTKEFCYIDTACHYMTYFDSGVVAAGLYADLYYRINNNVTSTEEFDFNLDTMEKLDTDELLSLFNTDYSSLETMMLNASSTPNGFYLLDFFTSGE